MLDDNSSGFSSGGKGVGPGNIAQNLGRDDRRTRLRDAPRGRKHYLEVNERTATPLCSDPYITDATCFSSHARTRRAVTTEILKDPSSINDLKMLISKDVKDSDFNTLRVVPRLARASSNLPFL